MKKNFLRLIIKSNSLGIKIYENFLICIFKNLKIKYKRIQIPTLKKRITLLKSPHVNKKAREQFELKIFKRVINIQSQINLKFIKYILINKPKFIKLNLRKII